MTKTTQAVKIDDRDEYEEFVPAVGQCNIKMGNKPWEDMRPGQVIGSGELHLPHPLKPGELLALQAVAIRWKPNPKRQGDGFFLTLERGAQPLYEALLEAAMKKS